MKLAWGILLLLLLSQHAVTAQAQTALERVERRVKDLLDTDQPAVAAEDQIGYLGVIANNLDDAQGVVVLEILPDGPADRAGLKVGDRIERIGDSDIQDMDTFAERMQQERVGKTLEFIVDREGRELVIDITLGKRPPPERRRFARFGRLREALGTPQLAADDALENRLMGILVEPVSPQRQQELGLPEARGAHVLDVVPGSPAARAGITAGTVIVALDGRRVSEPADLVLPDERAGSEVKLAFYKSGKLQERKLRLALPAEDPANEELPPADPRPGTGPDEEMPLPGEDEVDQAATDEESARVIKSLRAENRALEKRIQELEQRLKALEAKLK